MPQDRDVFTAVVHTSCAKAGNNFAAQRRLMTLAATLAVFAATSNSTAAWLEHRAKLVDSVLGYGVGKLPTRSTPD